MLQHFLHTILRRRHFWRHATFSEIAELYASRMLRILALHMVSLFVAIYLYQNGYSLAFIAFYLAIYYGSKIFIAFPAALIAARFGPKHGILWSNILYIPSLIAFTQVPDYGIWAIAVFGLFQALSATIYDVCYLVDFSKVKHVEHAGKEIGFMSVLEKITGGLSPLLGGAIASLISPEATIITAALIFMMSAWPLMRTAEPVKTHQKLQFRGFPWRTTWRSLRGETAVGFDVVATGIVWTLFVAVVIFAGSGQDVYVKIGALASVTVLTSFIIAYVVGRLIDRRQGGVLLRYSVIGKMISHLFRPFIQTPVGVAGMNIVSEATTTSYAMAFTRGMFDTADYSGRRITYILFVEIAMNVGAALACLSLGLLIVWLGDTEGMRAFFIVAAGYVGLAAMSRFALYRS